MPLSPESLVLQIWAMGAAFEARLARDLAQIDVTVAEFRLIGEVVRAENGIRQSELARRLGVRPPTVSAAVRRMEGNGLLERRRDPNDPRALLVFVAPSAPLGPGIELLTGLESELLSELGPEKAREFLDVLGPLTASLARSSQSGGGS